MLGREHVNGLYEYFMREHNGPNSTKFQNVQPTDEGANYRHETISSRAWPRTQS
jgi:hypothetical protein